ncbi:MAG: hypothetical protein HY268_23185 [Deltaproteobacteria bacterium]|nr:hypothetical protein [Deltaproteobacteria bacterium]
MSKEILKEEIKFLTEVFRLLWITLLGVGGGTISLGIGERTALKGALTVAGVLTFDLLGAVVQKLQQHIRRLIAQIPEG